jgi:hypothetical protein
MVQISKKRRTHRVWTTIVVVVILGILTVTTMVLFFSQSTAPDLDRISEMLRTQISISSKEDITTTIAVAATETKVNSNAMKFSLENLDVFVSCGAHIAPDCSQCLRHPNTVQDVWNDCNSDCSFDMDTQTCQPIPGPVSCGGHYADTCSGCLEGGKHPPSWCNGDCTYNHTIQQCTGVRSHVHPAHVKIFSSYKGKVFQEVRNDKGEKVNIVLLKTPLDPSAWKLVEKYKNDVLFMGISSFEAFPLSSPNPYSANFSNDLYRNAFPGWLTMMKHPEQYFDPTLSSTKYVLLSQSDFNLDGPLAFGRKYENILPKKYDWVYSGTDQNVLTDCKGWASFAKNWTFMLEALEVMCSPEFNLTGVIIANKDKSGTKACWIPDSCRDKVVQTTFLPNQTEFYEYTVQSHFMMVPNVYDASPRVVSQSLALNVPVLMNRNIIGGWKYLNEETGEFFDDMSNFANQLRKIVHRSRRKKYHPRRYMEANYGDVKAGTVFKNFVEDHFSDRVKLPPGTQWLVPAGS